MDSRPTTESLIQIEGGPRERLDEPKKGLLIAPEFPPNSFWSYRHVMKMVGKKAAFPPLGLITFAAYMPDNWDFELIDLNVEKPPDDVIKEKIASVDAVFASAMLVQKRSLVELLEGPARGLATPWVLGGPLPSSYRDEILEAKSSSDEVLRRGIDVLVWGEGGQWVEAINRLLHRPETNRHSEGEPLLLIPDEIANQRPGSRRILNDRSIFRPLGKTPLPRWDLVDIRDYRSLMQQTTVGCRFRCDFCDIIQFNGGFTRPKTVDSIREEMEYIYDLGHRGGVFTVDDNFVGNPQAIEEILRTMIHFQREKDYPFSFYTQASLDLGTPKLRHLLPLMKQAGFGEVFLGIENPDPVALKGMNKKQNIKVDIARTVAAIQSEGIEVMAGFIFGGDADTPDTADAIASFATDTAIPTAMTGLLMPVPHTPLAERLKAEGRLLSIEFSGNNTDDDVQFVPQNMTSGELREGYYEILGRLFAPGAMYDRAGRLLDRLNPHIFRGSHLRSSDLRAALLSVWRQGIRGSRRWRFYRLLWKAIRMDRAKYAAARRRSARMNRHFREVLNEGSALRSDLRSRLPALLDRAYEATVRIRPQTRLERLARYRTRVTERIETERATRRDALVLFYLNREFSERETRVHSFPGAYLKKAFELAIKGLHYQTVMHGMVKGARPDRANGRGGKRANASRPVPEGATPRS